MYLVNAVDSFCDMKLAGYTGNGEKKLYLSRLDSLDFIQNYLGISIAKGSNIYEYNDELRIRTRGYEGFVYRDNLEDVFNRSRNEYFNTTKYRSDLTAQFNYNQNILNEMNDRGYFRIDCSISENRIYIGSQDPNWFLIPSFCIPKESQVQIINRNNSGMLEFKIIY